MKLTPDTAKDVECPTQPRRCIGIACAAWRWSRTKETEAFLKDVQAYMLVESVPFNKAVQAVWAEKGGSYERNEGYCGVGGKPE